MPVHKFNYQVITHYKSTFTSLGSPVARVTKHPGFEKSQHLPLVYLCRVSTLKGIITYAVLLYLTVRCTRVTVWVILQNLGQVAFPLPPKSSEGIATHFSACGGSQSQTSLVVGLVPPALEFEAKGPWAPEW